MQPAPSREYHFPQKVGCAAWWPGAELWGKALLSRHWIWNNMHPRSCHPHLHCPHSALLYGHKSDHKAPGQRTLA